MRIFILFFFLLIAGCNSPQSSNLRAPSGLTCEYLKNPSVVDVTPRLGWINTTTASQHGERQTAYQIRVASARQQLDTPDLWDSNKVESDESTRIVYEGESLQSGRECYWQVRVWDKNGNPSFWSEPAYWRMGLLGKSDWKAQWIGAPWQGEEALPKPDGGPNGVPKEFGPAAPMFRKTFEVTKRNNESRGIRNGIRLFRILCKWRESRQ